jgi:hypothetical protein
MAVHLATRRLRRLLHREVVRLEFTEFKQMVEDGLRRLFELPKGPHLSKRRLTDPCSKPSASRLMN